MNGERVFVALMAVLMLGVGVVFLAFPRSTYSALERRQLLSAPTFSLSRLLSGQYTEEVSRWFSDSEPYRDELMTVSMHVKSAQSFQWGEEQVTFHASAADAPAVSTASGDETDDAEFADAATVPLAEENAVVTNSGVIVVGKAPTARALMAFGGKPKGAVAYARIVNRFAKAFAGQARVYCMPIPTAVEFYCPDQVRSVSVPERPILDTLFASLDVAVTAVDVYPVLAAHLTEPIYLRTDHHWAPLGAYYAAQCLAVDAGVTVPDLSEFDRHVMAGYVGSMFGYSQDHAVKDSPEDFVYYTPRLAYTTHYTVFHINDEYQIEGEGVAHDGPFFVTQPEGSSNAYSTFMGTDGRITEVHTPVDNGRRLLLMKDSFGNALPGYLFGSFQEVHVLDFRYFPGSVRDYVARHNITDILFANNLSHACSGAAARHYREWLDSE